MTDGAAETIGEFAVGLGYRELPGRPRQPAERIVGDAGAVAADELEPVRPAIALELGRDGRCVVASAAHAKGDPWHRVTSYRQRSVV